MSFVVNLHELVDGGVRVALRGGERCVAEEFLNGAEVSAVGEQVGGESVTQRMRVKIHVRRKHASVVANDT